MMVVVAKSFLVSRGLRYLKILYVDFNMPYLVKNSNYPVGGATVEWYSWIKGFEANNCDIHVLTWKGANEYIGKNNSIKLIESYDPQKGLRILRWIYYRLPALYKSIRNYKPDVIFQECACFNTGIMALIARMLNVPFIYRVANDVDVDERLSNRLSFPEMILFKYGLFSSNAILCQNNYQYYNLRSKYLNKLYVIYNPFYIKKLNHIIPLSARSYVAWLGIFQRQKNLPALLEVVRKMPEMEFRIAGKSQILQLDVENLIVLDKLSECNNVEFVGYLKRTEVIPFLSKAIALLNTSHYEGFSNTYLEAFAAGTPVVTTSSANPDNIISKEELGFVVDEHYKLSDALKELMTSADYDIITNKCQQYVIDNHNAVTLANRIVRIINDVRHQ